jgi:transcriptional antiterminator NusG
MISSDAEPGPEAEKPKSENAQPDEEPVMPEVEATETPRPPDAEAAPEVTETPPPPDAAEPPPADTPEVTEREPEAAQEAPSETAPEAPVDQEAAAAAAAAETPADEAPKSPPPVSHAPPAQEEVELVRQGMNWYVLRVASNKEDQVREALERKVKIEQLEGRVGRVLVPTQREKRMRGGTARVYHRKLYPGYVFVEMETDEDGRIPENVWFVIKETTGVGDFIGSGGKPSPMPMDDVKKMLAAAIRPEESPALANLAFKAGDRVKVNEGPFENFEGMVDEINAQKGTVRVIVSIFGRPTPIEIEYWQVEQL